VLAGKLAFFTAFGIPDNGFQGRGIREFIPRNFKGKASKDAWSSCGSCHLDGLVDGTTHIFRHRAAPDKIAGRQPAPERSGSPPADPRASGRSPSSFKNIVRPVRVYALRREAVADLPASSAPLATPVSQPAVAPHLSIVVLLFTNLSDDRR
jgi:hypothetical protein